MRVACARCGATLGYQTGRLPGHTLALILTAAILFLIANAYPIVTLESQGTQVSATLAGAVFLLWQSGMNFIAVLVLATAIASPGAEIALLLVVFTQRVPSPRLLRALKHLRPWAMIDVFVLGIIVAVKKLADMATIIPGPALWAFCSLMFLVTAIHSGGGLSPLWARLGHSGRARA